MKLHIPHLFAASLHPTGAWFRIGGTSGPGLLVTTRPLRSTRLHGLRVGRVWFRRLGRRA
mgnify:CR=1 FL=1